MKNFFPGILTVAHLGAAVVCLHREDWRMAVYYFAATVLVVTAAMGQK